MLYTIQNCFGEVYDTEPLPDGSGLTAQEWEEQLQQRLADIAGQNGIHTNSLEVNAHTGETIDQVTIDVDISHGNITNRVNRIHQTIGRIAANEPEPFGIVVARGFYKVFPRDKARILTRQYPAKRQR